MQEEFNAFKKAGYSVAFNDEENEDSFKICNQFWEMTDSKLLDILYGINPESNLLNPTHLKALRAFRFWYLDVLYNVNDMDSCCLNFTEFPRHLYDKLKGLPYIL